MTQLITNYSFFPSIQSTGGGDVGEEVCAQQEDNAVVQYRENKQADNDKLQHDGSNDRESVDENLVVESVASSVEDRLSCRGRLQTYIHSLPVQIFVLVLVALDVLIVLSELLLDVGAFNNLQCRGKNYTEQAHFCHYDLNFRPNCHPSPVILNNGENLTVGDGNTYCICGYRMAILTCIERIQGKKDDEGINPAVILHYFGLAILSAFVGEILLKLFAFRLKYFTHKFEVFDGIVVFIAWILDVSSTIKEEAFFYEFGALIIVLRLWRTIRIINGGVLSAKTKSDKQLQQARAQARDVVHALHKAQKKMSKQELELKQMNLFLEEQNIEVPNINTNTPKYPYDEEEGIDFSKIGLLGDNN